MSKYKAIYINISYIIISFFIFLFVGFTPVSAQAPEAFQVNPIIQEQTLLPGHITSYMVTITNTADRPLGIHAQVGPFTSPDEEEIVSSPLIQWIQIDPQDQIIPEGQKKTITITITPPNTVKKGGYYAGIFLTPFITNLQKQNSPIILTQVGTLLLAQYGETDYSNLAQKTHITEFSFTHPIFEHPPYSFHFHVVNSYFTHFTAKPFLTITPLFGEKQKIQLEEKHILPGKTKIWDEELTPASFSFFYTAELDVSVGEGHYITKKTYLVVLPGIHFVLLGILLLFLGLIAFYHKRARKALIILVKGNA